MTAVTDHPAAWPLLPRSVWVALRTFVEPYVGAAFTVPGDPAPKERRVGQGRSAFTPARTVAAEKRVWKAFREALPDWVPEYDRTYGVMVEFCTKSTSKVDVDNGMKLILDALNTTGRRAGFWGDDVQVGNLFANLVREGEPGVQVWLFAVEPNGTPLSKVCGCGTRYRSKDKSCRPCTTRRRVVNQLTTGDEAGAAAADRLARQRKMLFNHVAACLAATGVTPTIADMARRLDVPPARAAVVRETLIADGYLERAGRQLKIKKPLGAAA